MLLFPAKIGLSLKFPFNLDNHHHNSEALSASLHHFRSKIITHHILSKPRNESESSSLARFHSCFELMRVSSKSFADLVVEVDYPTTRWGGEATEEYLNYTLNLLNMLNSISSSVSHLNQAKISILHGLSLVRNSQSSAGKYLKKIATSNLGKDLGVKASTGIEIRAGSDEKERVILEALMILKKIGFLAIGLVLSGLDCSTKPYLEFGTDDPLNRVLESRFCKEMREMEGPMEEVNGVNRAIEQLYGSISSGTSDEAAAKELKGRLEVLENSIQSIDKEAKKEMKTKEKDHCRRSSISDVVE
ncbi:hypothetical protein ACS0TY_003227 [Phlomoides rotata]